MIRQSDSLYIKNNRLILLLVLRLFLGKLITKLKIDKILPKKLSDFYKVKSRGYEFQNSRRSESEIKFIEKFYVDKSIGAYIKEQEKKDIEKLSQYYPYKKLNKIIKKNSKFTICNLGIFYAKADFKFLEKHKDFKKLKIIGLDFGDIKKYNKNFVSEDRLELINGYSLKSLEKLHERGESLDLAIFVRTATTMNPNEFKEYVKILGKFCKSIMFLEVAKLTYTPQKKVNVFNISTKNSLRLFSGLYLHNYIKIPAQYGFKNIIESKVIPSSTFPNQSLSKDHNFIFVHLSK